MFLAYDFDRRMKNWNGFLILYSLDLIMTVN